MRILYSHRIQSRDGQAVHLESLIAALRADGHEVHLVGPGFFEAAEFGGESAMIARLRARLPAKLLELGELAYALHAYVRLWRAWRRIRPDFIYERCNLYHLAGALMARLHGARLLLEVNSPLADERREHGGLQFHGLAAALERFTWRSAYRVLPVSGVLAGIIAEAGVAAARIAVIRNGVDLARFAHIPSKPADAPVVLGFVGFVRAWHGLDHVISAMAQSPHHLELVVVGDGPVRAELEAQAAALGLGARVRFTGIVPQEAVAQHLPGFDIALQPMATSYASPLKIFDYMAASLAIVAPRQDNICEILRDGDTALLFAPGDHAAMWQAIETITADAALRARLGARARAELIAQDYTWAANARRVVALAQGGPG